MKKNLPINDNETVLKDTDLIISRTNAKGIVTFCNDDCYRISGFSENEVIGKAHNIFRHPDMPQEAFRDLWDTIKKGRAWRGVVKNRTKSGGYYWVRATVTPLPGVGFMSFRVKPTHEEIECAKDLYAKMSVDQGIRLHEGRIAEKNPVRRLLSRIGDVSLFAKIAAPVCLGFIVLVAFLYAQAKMTETQILEMHGHARASEMVQAARNARAFYLEHVISKTQQQFNISHEFEENANSLPLPASMMRSLSTMGAKDDKSSFKLVSAHPFAFRRNEQHLDDFDTEALAFLSQVGTGGPLEFGRLERVEDRPVYRYARADIMTDSGCTGCHNTHPDSPRQDWKVGDVRGIASATIDLEDIDQTFSALFSNAGMNFAASLIAFLSLFIWLLVKILNRLKCVSAFANSVAGGELGAKLSESSLDEIGQLAASVDMMRIRFQETAITLEQNTKKLFGVTDDLNSSVKENLKEATSQSEAAAAIAVSIEQMLASVEKLEAKADQINCVASQNGDFAGDGAKQIIAAIDQVIQSSEALSVCLPRLTELEGISAEINTIVASIREIADQTNLLALNAAIEAARAGESGRGFAVVADEVRKLAGRTAEATQSISGMTSRIHERTKNTVSELGNGIASMNASLDKAKSVGGIVERIQADSLSIVEATSDVHASLKEQSEATQDIAKLVEEVSTLAQSTNERARLVHQSTSDATKAAQEIKNILSDTTL